MAFGVWFRGGGVGGETSDRHRRAPLEVSLQENGLIGSELDVHDLQRVSDLIGSYRGTYRIVYRVLQPLLGVSPLTVPFETLERMNWYPRARSGLL